MVFVILSSLFYFPTDSVPLFAIPHLDKMVHFSFYFGAAVFGSLCIREQTGGRERFKKVLFLTTLSSIICGIIIEVLQETLTTYRDGNVYDVLANTLGAVSGAMVIWYVFSFRNRFNWKN